MTMKFSVYWVLCFTICLSTTIVHTAEIHEGKDIVQKISSKNQPIILTAQTGLYDDGDDSNLVSQSDRSRQSLIKNMDSLHDSKLPFVPPTFITGAHLLQGDLISDASLPGISKAQSISSNINLKTVTDKSSGNAIQSDEAIEYIKPSTDYRWIGSQNYEEEDYSDPVTESPSITETEADYNIGWETNPETIGQSNYADDFESMALPTLNQQNQPTIPAHVAVRSSIPWAQRDINRQGQPYHTACTQPLDRGLGPDEVSSWYYDSKDGRCRWFGYRGYGGNANRFYSRNACEGLCIHDKNDLCETVNCLWPSTTCQLVGDQSCKDYKQQREKPWEADCPPDQPVCVSRRNTRMAPDINFDHVPPECMQEANPGSCEKKNPSVNFFYDRERNDCMAFYFHDCGGNDNRFETKSECMTHCSP